MSGELTALLHVPVVDSLHPPSLNEAISGVMGRFSQISQVMFVPDVGCLKLLESLFCQNMQFGILCFPSGCHLGAQCLSGVLSGSFAFSAAGSHRVGSGWKTRLSANCSCNFML